MPKLFIRLNAPAVITDEGYEVDSAWMIQEDDGRMRAHGETDFRGLSELIDPGTEWLQAPTNVVVIVPGDHVLSLSCQVPGRNVGQVRRALPFVVEEFVTTDIESMQLATGEMRRNAPVQVSLIERTLLGDWLSCLEALRIAPGYLFSEAELLPVAAGQASILLDGDRALIRTPDQAAAVDRDNLALAVSVLGVERIVVVHGVPTDLEAGELAQHGALEVTGAAAADHGVASVLVYAASHWTTCGAVNLLQGDFKARQPINPLWERWRPVAALLAIWVGVALLAMTAESIYAGYQADRLETASVDLYRDIFPKETRITNVRRQLQAKLGERTSDGGVGFVDFLGPLAAGMNKTTRIQSLNFTGERGELAVDLIIGGYDALDGLKERLGGEGVNVEITSAEQMDNGVRARLRLRGTGA